jgi:NAD(P)-dependent dehydrogenase (short-subunit alcohol dehydrogenase family)
VHTSRCGCFTRDDRLVIAGGGNGIGKETALKLAHYGFASYFSMHGVDGSQCTRAKVVIADLNLSAAEKAASEIVDKGGYVLFFLILLILVLDILICPQ